LAVLVADLLMSSPRVTVVGGTQDQAAVAVSRGKLRSSSQILPTFYIRSGRSAQFHLTPLPLSSPVPPPPRKAYVFTRDLERLVEDLRKADDKAAVIRRYKDALILKREVCCEFRSGFMITYLHPKVYRSVGRVVERGRRCDCPRQAD